MDLYRNNDRMSHKDRAELLRLYVDGLMSKGYVFPEWYLKTIHL